jgi:cell division protein FtsB
MANETQSENNFVFYFIITMVILYLCHLNSEIRKHEDQIDELEAEVSGLLEKNSDLESKFDDIETTLNIR